MPRFGLWAAGAALFALAVIAHPNGPLAAVLGLGGIGCMFGAWVLNVRTGAYGRRGEYLPTGGDGGAWGGAQGTHDAGITGGDGGAGGDFGGGGFFGGGDFGGGGGGDGGGG